MQEKLEQNAYKHEPEQYENPKVQLQDLLKDNLWNQAEHIGFTRKREI